MARKVLSRRSPLAPPLARPRHNGLRRQVTAAPLPPGGGAGSGQVPALALTPEQLKHLDYIQDAVGRHVTHAFAVKGWSLTVTGVVFAYAAGHRDLWIALVALLPPLAFAWLDLYYLRQTHLFEELYRAIIQADPAVRVLDLDTARYHDSRAHPRCSYRQCMKMSSWWVLHLMVLSVGLALLVAVIVT